MISRIKNRKLRRLLLVLTTPPILVLAILMGAVAGAADMVEEVHDAAWNAWKE